MEADDLSTAADNLEALLEQMDDYQDSEWISYESPVILADEYMVEGPIHDLEKEIWKRYSAEEPVTMSVSLPENEDGYRVRVAEGEPYLKDVVIEVDDTSIDIAQITGFSGGKCKLTAQIQTDAVADALQAHRYIEEIAAKYKPSADTGEDAGYVPDETWDDIVLPEDVEERIRDRILRPLVHPGIYESVGLDIEKGVLLEGPPGTGKTLLARVIAGEYDAEFYSVSTNHFTDSLYGQSEQNVSDIFEKAREGEDPAIIFVDEIDSLLKNRNEPNTHDATTRIVTEFLKNLDGVEPLENVMVIGATNRYDALDPAVIRTGRFGERITLRKPGYEARKEILDVHTRDGNFADDIDYAEIAEQTEDFVGSDISDLVDEARWNAIRRADDVDETQVTAEDFENALETVREQADETGTASHSVGFE